MNEVGNEDITNIYLHVYEFQPQITMFYIQSAFLFA